MTNQIEGTKTDIHIEHAEIGEPLIECNPTTGELDNVIDGQEKVLLSEITKTDVLKTRTNKQMFDVLK